MYVPPDALSTGVPPLPRIVALAARERRTRFADGRIGYAWAFITPIVWIGFVVILFRLLGRVPPIHAGPEIFVATAIIPYLAVRQTITAISRSHAAGRHLRYIPGIRIIDLLLATALLEGINLVAVTILICGGIIAIFGADLPAEPLGIGLTLLTVWLLGTGVGRLIAAIGLFSDGFARAVPLMLRPLFWISGIFYTAQELPGAAQAALWYNPLLHVTESMREAFFASYGSPIASLWYPTAFACACFLIAHPIERRAEIRRTGRHRL